MAIRRIKWDKDALQYFSDAIKYISKDSPQNSEKVKREILSKISDLAHRPEIHPPDKYRQDNDGSCRAFEMHRYRVAYLIKEEEIIIIRVRHTSQEPLNY